MVMPLCCTAGFQDLESGVSEINISSPIGTENGASNPRKFGIAVFDLAIVFLKNGVSSPSTERRDR